ncbi:hypothetical protein CLAFUW4_07935 [Fulvia fulva]|uniref:Rhodanese domain-containing protein n=1 Tax=Passalora fulva TaxID=5499 RepID=A0A9Q8P6U8_PASFU|nr:uncharacterized protein CLAFUR5_08058 [Fulvia fulva]KAK4629359.1 hypothetical protein CLAFUR4_07940 [Fulvia fulva]KAK4629842.1 hypothetical protein CLAFUR0_07937 [Fulvia fulva]UJO15212.1 hypothetical protein CLAFUR5_08058 [Fulvia fulva]WPV12377.1 hypothetical protein CLAFUW4_07935 [Fulvia fulva]WPV27299.1 hypothetical protein CLAFUW7_07936 [Fulvia fulva]
MVATDDKADEKPWHAAFPEPTITADVFPRSRALMIMSLKIGSMLIVDVRRTDYEGGAIRGSINIPAQGFYWNRGVLYELAYKSSMEWVVFTCGSSNGRGPRCAAWFLEHVRNVAGDNDMNVTVLEGGLKGWVKAGPQYTQYMDGFEKAYWEKALGEPIEDKPILNPPGSGSFALPEGSVSVDKEPETVSAQKASSSSATQEKVWSWDPSMMDSESFP